MYLYLNVQLADIILSNGAVDSNGGNPHKSFSVPLLNSYSNLCIFVTLWQERSLAFQEALELLESLPSDTESEVSDLQNSEEVYVPGVQEIDQCGETVSDPQNFSEVSDSENSDFTVPGSSKPIIPTWNKRDMSSSLQIFNERTDPLDELLSSEEFSPINIFLTLLTCNFIQTQVFQTNLYATQKGQTYIPITLEEILCFLSINLYMGLKKLPSYRDYLSISPVLHDDYTTKRKLSKRFSWLLLNLHLNDNSVQPKRGERNFDKLYKVHPLLDHLSERFLSSYQPNKNQSIDESMIKFKRRSSFKQYMKKKPIKK
ncbi:PiggyBac transposable element-derived protein 3, partial [Stegodyphus mimosarum]